MNVTLNPGRVPLLRLHGLCLSTSRRAVSLAQEFQNVLSCAGGEGPGKMFALWTISLVIRCGRLMFFSPNLR